MAISVAHKQVQSPVILPKGEGCQVCRNDDHRWRLVASAEKAWRKVAGQCVIKTKPSSLKCTMELWKEAKLDSKRHLSWHIMAEKAMTRMQI